jgi:hypothetical protein
LAGVKDAAEYMKNHALDFVANKKPFDFVRLALRASVKARRSSRATGDKANSTSIEMSNLYKDSGKERHPLSSTAEMEKIKLEKEKGKFNMRVDTNMNHLKESRISGPSGPSPSFVLDSEESSAALTDADIVEDGANDRRPSFSLLMPGLSRIGHRKKDYVLSNDKEEMTMEREKREREREEDLSPMSVDEDFDAVHYAHDLVATRDLLLLAQSIQPLQIFMQMARRTASSIGSYAESLSPYYTAGEKSSDVTSVETRTPDFLIVEEGTGKIYQTT